MTLSQQLLGLPLFVGLFKSCHTCGTPFIPSRPNLVHQLYHTHQCWLRAYNERRREKARLAKVEPVEFKAMALPSVCCCGAPLVRVESDWMTGQTIEVCTLGHRTNPVLRRRTAA